METDMTSSDLLEKKIAELQENLELTSRELHMAHQQVKEFQGLLQRQTGALTALQQLQDEEEDV
tara:strand:+ start:872 stop:1063 length:192 start_codon:yes stop_codon:yes gene_type:complete